MIQVATFRVPEQQAEANEFLKTHKPEGNINFNRDTIIVFYDDGAYPPEYEIADYQSVLEGCRKTIANLDMALYMLRADLADLSPVKNKGKYEQIDNAVIQTQRERDDQERKAAYLEGKIQELKNSLAK